jgi:hypothetical protein
MRARIRALRAPPATYADGNLQLKRISLTEGAAM